MRCSLIFSKAGHILENHIAHFLQKYYIFAVTAKVWSRNTAIGVMKLLEKDYGRHNHKTV